MISLHMLFYSATSAKVEFKEFKTQVLGNADQDTVARERHCAGRLFWVQLLLLKNGNAGNKMEWESKS